MPHTSIAIDICMQCRFLRVTQYQRNNGRYCAEITATDPLTGFVSEKVVSSQNKAKCEQKLETAKRELYSLIRDNFIKCHLLATTLTLQSYLELDLPFFQKQWPKSYGLKEYQSLEQYADTLSCNFSEYLCADDFLGPLAGLKLTRELELTVLRMLNDIIDELIRLGLYLHENPIKIYYLSARSIDNWKKKRTQHHICMALSDHAILGIFGEYSEKHLKDPRYFAVPLRALGLSAAQIAAIDIGDIVQRDSLYSLLIHKQMILCCKRYVRDTIPSEWESRLLPMGWLRTDIEQWIKKYESIGLYDVQKIPLCAYGFRKHPKRCTPEEIEAFLQRLIDRHTKQSSELRPGTIDAKQSFREVSNKITPKAFHESFLVAGSVFWNDNPFFARYLFGEPAETVDEKVYLDFTLPRIQENMNSLILQVFDKMTGGQTDIVKSRLD